MAHCRAGSVEVVRQRLRAEARPRRRSAPWPDRWFEVFQLLRRILACALLALLALRVAGALKHRFLDKRAEAGVLRRMLEGPRGEPMPEGGIDRAFGVSLDCGHLPPFAIGALPNTKPLKSPPRTRPDSPARRQLLERQDSPRQAHAVAPVCPITSSDGAHGGHQDNRHGCAWAPSADKDRRFIVIHGNLMTREQIVRAKRLGGRVDAQNIFMWDKAAAVERCMGPVLANRAVPSRWLLDTLGVEGTAAGTDNQVNTLNPFINMYVMVTRQEALRLYTNAGPYYTFEERKKGSIEVGKFADMVVLSVDYLTVPDSQIKDIKLLQTIVDGKAVYDAQQ
jgi:hypothetical protein